MDQFLNTDKRLRPTGAPKPEKRSDGPAEYAIDDEHFPELFGALEKLRSQVGLSGFRFVVLGDGFGGAGIDFPRKLIGIGIGKLNTLSFEAVLAVIGHEFGHAFRKEHPTAPKIGRDLLALNPPQMEEVEADRFSACLLGEKQANIAALQSGVSMDPGLPISLRVTAIEELNLAQCPDLRPSYSRKR